MTEFTIPVPEVWRRDDLADAERVALEATAALANGTGNRVDEAADIARSILNSVEHKPELVLLVGEMHRVHGTDIGYDVILPTITPPGRVDRSSCTVYDDLLIEPHLLPPGYRSEAQLRQATPAVVIARIVLVDSAAQTLTVELFSRSDQYEVVVPDSIVLDETCLSESATRRRRIFYKTLAAEFGTAAEGEQ